MSSDYAIEVNNLGKSYQIYDKPSDRLKQMLFRGRRRYYKEFWALKDVSFKVKKGETVGIIGRNGSGKSTLLQMICGTLNPTVGEIKVNGKVAALLELGAGFNPEFTGVENVYMAASLYGLTKEEIDQRFEAITAFADIGEHINQPVKTYSSGMYVRLAFAVIANVDAEILVIDEALAVGDAIFTQKCMRFIREFKKAGTLLFVSHDISSVQSLCDGAIWLDFGSLKGLGSAKAITENYLKSTFQELYGEDVKLNSLGVNKTESNITEIEVDSVISYDDKHVFLDNLYSSSGWETGAGSIVSVEIRNKDNLYADILAGGEEVKLVVRARANKNIYMPMLGFLVRDRLGQDLFGENTSSCTKLRPLLLKSGDIVEAVFVFRLPNLQNGKYFMMVSLAEGDMENHIQHHWLNDALVLNVSSSKVRWGIVGINFKEVSLRILDEAK